MGTWREPDGTNLRASPAFRRGLASLSVAVSTSGFGLAVAAVAIGFTQSAPSWIWFNVVILIGQVATLAALVYHDRWERKAVDSLNHGQSAGKVREIEALAKLREITEKLDTREKGQRG